MVDFVAGDVVIGGEYGYAEHINTSGVHQQHITLQDDNGNLMKVWGATFTPQGDAYFALGALDSYEDYTPHDIVYIPGTNPVQFLVIIGRTDDTIELRKYDADGNILATYLGLNRDTDWAHETPLKMAVACDGHTVYYTDQGRTIFRYDITGSGTQLADFAQLAVGSPYIYAGIDIQPDGDLYVAMTVGGVGPKRDVTVGGIDNIWTDQVNETPVKVYKRSITDGSEILNHEVSLSPSGDNDEVLALAAYYYGCGRMFPIVTLIGAN